MMIDQPTKVTTSSTADVPRVGGEDKTRSCDSDFRVGGEDKTREIADQSHSLTPDPKS